MWPGVFSIFRWTGFKIMELNRHKFNPTEVLAETHSGKPAAAASGGEFPHVFTVSQILFATVFPEFFFFFSLTQLHTFLLYSLKTFLLYIFQIFFAVLATIIFILCVVSLLNHYYKFCY
jgi:hypothetical protein